MNGSRPQSPSIPEEWLTAYLDDELTAEHREQVEAAVSQDAKLAQLLEELRATRQLVSHLPQFAQVARRTAAEVGASVDELEDGIVEPSKGQKSTARTFDARSDRSGLPWRWLAMAAATVGIAAVGGLLWVRPSLTWSSLGLNDSLPAPSVDALATRSIDAESTVNEAATGTLGEDVGLRSEADAIDHVPSASPPAMDSSLVDSFGGQPAAPEANGFEAAAARPAPSALSATESVPSGAASQIGSLSAPLAESGSGAGFRSAPDNSIALAPLSKSLAVDPQRSAQPTTRDLAGAPAETPGIGAAMPGALPSLRNDSESTSDVLPAPASRQALTPAVPMEMAEPNPSNAIGGRARPMSTSGRDAPVESSRGRGALPRASWHQSAAWAQKDVAAQINSNGLFRPIKRLLPAEQQSQLSPQLVADENVSTAVLRLTMQQLEQLALKTSELGIQPAVEVTRDEASQALFVSRSELAELLSAVSGEKNIFWIQSSAASDSDRRCVLIINSGQ